MKFFCYNHLGSCVLLLQFAIFVVGSHRPDSGIFLSEDNDKCNGTEVKKKCEEKGRRLARIRTAGSLLAVKIPKHGNKEYWTGLSWHKGTFYWNGEKASAINHAITRGTRDDQWYCFFIKSDEDRLGDEPCQERKRYICEKVVESASATVSSPGLIAPSLASGISADTVLPSGVLTTSTINIKTSLTLTKTATAAAMSRSELITHSPKTNLSVNTVLQSSILTTEMVNPTEALTLTTGAIKTSIAESSSSYGSTQGKKAAKEEFQRYTAQLKAFNVSKKGSLQNAANTTSNFFKELRKRKVKTNDINVLLATQEFESFAMNYGKTHYKANESNVISEENYAMMIQRIPADRKEAVIFAVNETAYSVKEGWASISVPSGAFQGKDAVVVCIVYNDIKQWVPDEKHVELEGKTLTNLELRSRIIAGRVEPTPVGILEENVTILFSYDKGSKEEATPHCVFWNFSIKSELNGSWSSKGCSLVKIVNNEITCSCNHLTNFAILMQVGGNKEVSPDHKVVLQMITYIGCVLSLIGEVLTLIAYCVLMDLKQEQIQIRLNLVVAIAIAQIAFLSGIDATETTGVCVFVAALIHFFYLVGFAWMLVEGIYLYLMVVKVFNTAVKMWLFYAASWGLPVVIVVLSIGIASSQDGGVHNYVHGDFCWVSFTNNLVWTFVAPVLVVCLINSVILACVVREILKMQSAKTSELERIRQGAKACAVLFPLLGMTWLFGILSVTDAGLVFQYIFTILNSLQGFFIFILHVLKNSEVRAEFDRKKQKWKTSRSVGSSHETRQPSSDISTNKVINSDTYELDNKQKESAYLPESDDYSPVVLRQHKNITPVDT